MNTRHYHSRHAHSSSAAHKKTKHNTQHIVHKKELAKFVLKQCFNNVTPRLGNLNYINSKKCLEFRAKYYSSSTNSLRSFSKLPQHPYSLFGLRFDIL